MTNVRQNLKAFFADISLREDRMGTDIRETLTLLTCGDCSTFLCIFRQFLALFGTFCTFRLFFPSGADGEVACHSQEHLKPCDIFLRIIQKINMGPKLPKNTSIATTDLTGEYQNISQQDGLDCLNEALEEKNDKTIPSDF